jgi:hypothetical protein
MGYGEEGAHIGSFEGVIDGGGLVSFPAADGGRGGLGGVVEEVRRARDGGRGADGAGEFGDGSCKSGRHGGG